MLQSEPFTILHQGRRVRQDVLQQRQATTDLRSAPGGCSRVALQEVLAASEAPGLSTESDCTDTQTNYNAVQSPYRDFTVLLSTLSGDTRTMPECSRGTIPTRLLERKGFSDSETSRMTVELRAAAIEAGDAHGSSGALLEKVERLACSTVCQEPHCDSSQASASNFKVSFTGCHLGAPLVSVLWCASWQLSTRNRKCITSI